MPDDQDRKNSPDGRFNPFINEGDMFKVLLYVAGFCAVVALIALLVRSL